MVHTDWIAAWLLTGVARLRGKDVERGDVPGWVMVTVMTAGLVVIIFGVFSSQIRSAITDAIDSVTNGTKE